MQISLSKNGVCKKFLIHRLVAQHFIKNPLRKQEVNHIDYCTTNNHYKNLEWCTRKENMDHCFLKNSNVRNYCECSLYYKDHLLSNFKSVSEASRFASSHFKCSESMLRKYYKNKGLRIIAIETQSTIPKGSTPEDKLLVEAPTTLPLIWR